MFDYKVDFDYKFDYSFRCNYYLYIIKLCDGTMFYKIIYEVFIIILSKRYVKGACVLVGCVHCWLCVCRRMRIKEGGGGGVMLQTERLRAYRAIVSEWQKSDCY